MELHTNDEVITMLHCIDCGVAEFREIGQIALNCLSNEQQQFVYSLFNSEDDRLRHSAIYAVYRQETWSVPFDLFEKLKNIYLNDPNSHIRKQSIMTLCRFSMSLDMKIEALTYLLEKENDLTNFMRLAGKEKEIVDYFYDKVMELFHTGQIEELSPQFLAKHGCWSDEVKNYLHKNLQSEIADGYPLHSIEALLDIDVPQNHLIDFLLTALRCTKNFYAIDTIVTVAGKKNVITDILPFFFQQLDQLGENTGELGNNDHIIDIGITVSPYFKQLEQNFESYWNEHGEISRGIILTVLLHSREKTVIATKIAIEALSSTNYLNVTLGIALCFYYNISTINIPSIPDNIWKSNSYLVSKLVLWITRQQLRHSIDVSKTHINQFRNKPRYDYFVTDDLIGHLIFCRHQYRKIINLIDKSFVDYCVSDKINEFNPSQMQLFIQEIQRTVEESLGHLVRLCDRSQSSMETS
jgi:hypothetical protein